MNQKDRLDFWRIALHEAGHLLAHIALGGGGTAKIFSDREGSTTRDGSRAYETFVSAVTDAAGEVAEAFVERWPPPPHDPSPLPVEQDGWWHGQGPVDAERIATAAKPIGLPPHILNAAARLAAKLLLSDRELELVALAQQFYAHGTIAESARLTAEEEAHERRLAQIIEKRMAAIDGGEA
jgi:hypothetical protein